MADVQRVKAQRVRRFISIGVFALVGWTVGIIGVASYQTIQNTHAQERAAQASTEIQFWRMVAGQASSAAPTVENRLARDLAEVIELGQPDLGEDVLNFRGSSNLYGGISEAIGYDPFDGSGLNCEECGPLSRQMLDNILTTQRGNVNQVVNAIDTQGAVGLTLTPLGMPFWAMLVLLWLVGTPIIVILAQVWAYENDGVPFSRVPWGTWCILVSPVLFGTYFTLRHLRERALNNRLNAKFPEQMRLIADIDRYLEENHDPRLLAAKLDLLDELKTQDVMGRDGGVLRDYTREIEDQMVVLGARREAYNELEE